MMRDEKDSSISIRPSTDRNDETELAPPGNEMRDLQQKFLQSQRDLQAARRALSRAVYKGRQLESRYQSLLRSSSWLATEPLRSLIRSVRRQEKTPALPAFFHSRRIYNLAVEMEEATPRQAAKDTDDAVLIARGLLWGGQPDAGEQELKKLINHSPLGTNARAAVELATWYDFNGDSESALRLLESAGKIAGLRLPIRDVQMRLSSLYARVGQIGKARQALDILPPSRVNSHVQLLRSNLAENDSERLERVNAVFVENGLAPIRRRYSNDPLSLRNLEGDQVECLVPDLGKVSVIVPAYSAGELLEVTIRSLCQQTYKNLEIIVVDDCSPDNTYEVAKKLAMEDPRIIVLRQTKNGGAYRARNLGLSVASGKYITTHDADDWSHPQKIERQLEALVGSPGCIGVSSYWARVLESLHFTTNWRLSACVLYWNHSSFLFHREVIGFLGAWDEVTVSADTEFIWRIEAAYGQGSVQRILSNVPLSFGLDDDTSLTRTKVSHVRTIYYGMRQYYREICRYWHEQYPDGLDAEAAEQKRSMIPSRMYDRNAPEENVDLHLYGDCASEDCVRQMIEISDARVSQRIGVSHMPDPVLRIRRNTEGYQFCNQFFELLARDNVVILLPELGFAATEAMAITRDAVA